MKNTFIWTYTLTEEEIFERQEKFIGRWIESEEPSFRLFIVKQRCVEFEKEATGVKIIANKVSDSNCPVSLPIDNLYLSDAVTLFSHNASEIKGSEYLPEYVTVLDYSSADGAHYSQMMQEVQKAATDKDLVSKAINWQEIYRKDYTANLIRRVHNYSLNLFLPTSIDIQSIQNLWKKKELERFKEWIEYLAEQWAGSLPVSRSPSAQLCRLWYIIAAEKLDWRKMGTPPPLDVSLPKDNQKKVEKSFYEWMIFFLRKEHPESHSKAFKALLELVGLGVSGSGIEVSSFSCILNFIKTLEAIVNCAEPHLWLKGLTATANTQDHLQQPLNFLWHLLSKAEAAKHNVHPLFEKNLSYEQIHDELVILRNITAEPRTTTYPEWLNQLSFKYDDILKELETTKRSNERIRLTHQL